MDYSFSLFETIMENLLSVEEVKLVALIYGKLSHQILELFDIIFHLNQNSIKQIHLLFFSMRNDKLMLIDKLSFLRSMFSQEVLRLLKFLSPGQNLSGLSLESR